MADNALESIRAAGTRIIADTEDFSDIERFKPSEGTTNPSLILAAAKIPAHSHLFARSIEYLRTSQELEPIKLSRAVEQLSVDFGAEIWRLTGRLSTELDVSLSFDAKGTVDAALRVIELYRL